MENLWSGQVLDQAAAAAWAAALRASGQRVVFTNGCFDLLHRGHVDYLQRARALGDALAVGLNGDGSVRLLKGAGRPILPEADRAAVLAALRAVDVVVIFHEPTAEALVAAVQPALYVKGGDWDSTRRVPPEAAVALGYGGRVQYIPYLPGRSTSEIVAQIRS
ncbi:MAG TPA: adenylyltransferase/cytidyltransferase family protein [Anaerolineae bacterium]|nr:adenylyltransferase/cytidyltransferase family protein [Anaerolineae bacterium]